MSKTELLSMLRELEVSLQQPGVRRDLQRLNALLQDEYLEFGRSGHRYGKADVLAVISSVRTFPCLWSQDFTLRQLASDVALVTYRSACLGEAGTLEDPTLRASIWQRSPYGWQISLHQGTPTSPFAQVVP